MSDFFSFPPDPLEAEPDEAAEAVEDEEEAAVPGAAAVEVGLVPGAPRLTSAGLAAFPLLLLLLVEGRFAPRLSRSRSRSRLELAGYVGNLSPDPRVAGA